MRRVTLLLVVIGTLLASAGSARAAGTALDIVPWGQVEPGAPWANQPGMLPAATQADMYDRLTPLFRSVTPAQLAPSTDGRGYFKSEALVNEDDPTLISLENVSGHVPGRPGTLSARVRRDAYGVPEIYSDTDDGVIFAAGWVTAEDRSLLLAVARNPAYVATVDIPGTSSTDLIFNGGTFTPSAALKRTVDRRETRALKHAGRDGRQTLRDIRTYLAGMNAWLAVHAPSTAPFTRSDIYALNALKGQFLGEGGGSEVANALALAAFQKQLGRRRGFAAYQDLRQRDDPSSAVTTTHRFPYQTHVPVRHARGRVPLVAGSFQSAAPAVLSASARAAAAAPPRREASNALLVNGRRSADGRPIMVAGPQLPYTYPGFTLEMGLYGPHIHVRGVTSAPFPGYMLIGRGRHFAWSLTSAGVDIVDIYAEHLCGHSPTRYRYDGRCRRMTTLDTGSLARNGRSQEVVEHRTVHGPVIGYARDARTHRLVALTRKRSSGFRDTNDQLFFRDLTFGRVHNAHQFFKAAAKTPQTFNSFYVSRRQIAFYTTGRFPVRPHGVNPDLPVDGRGRYEWTGFLKASRHPHVINPGSGEIVNWNNKPARGFPAGDERWDEGSIQRQQLLTRELARRRQATPASVVAAMNAAATEDVRIVKLWPTLRAVLARGNAPSQRDAAMVYQLQRWRRNGGSRLDTNDDGNIDAPGAAILDRAWDGLAHAAMCRRLGTAGCDALATRMSVFDTPPGGQYAGWHQYLRKDLRTLLGRRVHGHFRLSYCGDGHLRRCSQDLWRALDQAGNALQAQQGPNPATWHEPAERVHFAPLPLTTIRYTNRPSGIQQVIAFRR
jgi:acyl-homoserine lactone acylase PvdQ